MGAGAPWPALLPIYRPYGAYVGNRVLSTNIAPRRGDMLVARILSTNTTPRRGGTLVAYSSMPLWSCFPGAVLLLPATMLLMVLISSLVK